MTSGTTIANRIEGNLTELSIALGEFTSCMPHAMVWIQRDWQLYENNPAHILLVGAKVSLLESATSWAIGSNRGAAASLRAAVENAFAWLYYKDHPVEFKSVIERRMDLLLPKAVQTYFKSMDGGFEASYEMLKKLKSRPNEYFYSDISQFVHAHPGYSAQSQIEEIVISSPRDGSFLNICKFTDEFIGDNYTTYYRTSWGDFPPQIQHSIAARLGTDLTKFVENH